MLTEGYPSPGGDDGLTLLLSASAAGFMVLTGRVVGDDALVGQPGPFGCSLEALPVMFEPLALRAMTVFAERLSVMSDAEFTSDAISNTHGGLASISAGPWSESYFAPGSTVERKSLDEDPVIAGMLWAMATDCVRAAWERLWNPELAGLYPPARATSVTDWFPESGAGPWPYDVYGCGWSGLGPDGF